MVRGSVPRILKWREETPEGTRKIFRVRRRQAALAPHRKEGCQPVGDTCLSCPQTGANKEVREDGRYWNGDLSYFRLTVGKRNEEITMAGVHSRDNGQRGKRTESLSTRFGGGSQLEQSEGDEYYELDS